jgi:hypothetical protein
MKFIPIRSYDNYIDAHIIMGRLKENGIDCWLKDENTVTIDPILTNAVGGIKLMVQDIHYGQAAGLLNDFHRSEQLTHPCTKCKSLNVELVTTPRKPGNWFSVLLGVLFTSYAMPVEKVYHCFDCGNEFILNNSMPDIKAD